MIPIYEWISDCLSNENFNQNSYTNEDSICEMHLNKSGRLCILTVFQDNEEPLEIYFRTFRSLKIRLIVEMLKITSNPDNFSEHRIHLIMYLLSYLIYKE